jgi:hypothetical protein
MCFICILGKILVGSKLILCHARVYLPPGAKEVVPPCPADGDIISLKFAPKIRKFDLHVW